MLSQSAAAIYFEAVDLFMIFWFLAAAVLIAAWAFSQLAIHTRPMRNCLIVAVALWIEGGCRQWLGVRRSRPCRGLLPHFGAAHHGRWRNVRVIEYIPSRHASLDSGLLFQGEYRVWHLRVTDVRRFTDRAAALAHNPRTQTC
jgi:hypothetical protein